MIIQFILEICKQAQLLPEQASDTGKSLADISPSVAYLMLSHLALARDPKILAVLRAHAPTTPMTVWPTDAPPAGLLMLLMDKTPKVRTWASLQIATCTQRPTPLELFTTTHVGALQLCTNAITTSGSNTDSEFVSTELLPLWQGYSALLRFVPNEWLYPSVPSRTDIRQIVIGHLSDTGDRKCSCD